MAPKKSKTVKVSTGVPERLSEQAATEHADEFHSTLAQKQTNVQSPVYSPFPLTLRGPFQTPFLGPHYYQAKPEGLLSLDTQLVRAPFSYGLEDIDWGSWDANLERLGSNPDVPVFEVYFSWPDWVDEMQPLFADVWKRNGIYYAILLSKNRIDLNPSLLGAALCFWDNTLNTFSFGPGPMTPTILDMAALFGFKPWGGNIDVLGDYEVENRKVKVSMKASKTEILRLKTYSGFMMSFQGMADREQEHMMFLLFWLN
ncbi:hypothetical protein CerSpe_114740 [Prunus speciosa]